jgi:spermidine synthase
MLSEILKYPIKKVDYAELDPLIIDLVNKFPTELTFKELMDKRVHIKFLDGRQFVKNAKENYDVIFVNLDLPSSLQLNRFYTKDFFEEAKRILNSDGLIVIKCWGSMVYLGKPQKNINASFLKTLEKTFNNVRVIPGETNIYIASKELKLDKIRAMDIKNWKKLYKIKTRLLTDSYIDYRLDPYWQKWFLDSLKDADKNVLNLDFTPRGLFYGLNLLYNLISPKTKYFFDIASKINLTFLIAIILIFNLIFIILRKSKKLKHPPIPFLIGITGFSGITFQLIIILGFQIVFGFLYYWIGILTSAFMLGLAAGAGLINKNLEKIKEDLDVFLKLEAALFIFALVLPLILGLHYFKVNLFVLRGIFFVLSVVAGFLAGTEFPLANKIYWKDKESIGYTAGSLYASDLIGACIGCLLVPAVFIPVMGILKTCLLVAFLKLSSIVIIKNSE